jgi:CubicO group peptidase (beta-lactamase class C family)
MTTVAPGERGTTVSGTIGDEHMTFLLPLPAAAPRPRGSPVFAEHPSRAFKCVVVAILVAGSACAADHPVAPLPPEIDRSQFDSLVRDMGAGAMGDIRSLIVLIGEQAPVEHYFRGTTRSDVAPVYSISKSVTSLLTGLALDAGALDSLRAPIRPLFASHDSLFAADPRRAQITVEDLLTMRAGIAWDELSIPYANPANLVGTMLTTRDWAGFVLSQPMAAVPGSRYAYSSGATTVLGEVVARATRRPLASFAQERLFGPLGIPAPTWQHSANGVANAGSGLSLRPLDLLRIGRLVRDHGHYNGVQVVRAAWIASSLQPHVGATAVRYGYQWWMWGARGAWDPDDPVYAASGWGGQTILVFPSRNAAIVVTARNFDRDPIREAQALTQRFDGILARAGNQQTVGIR